MASRPEGTPTSFGAAALAGGYGTVAGFNGDGWPDVALGFLCATPRG